MLNCSKYAIINKLYIVSIIKEIRVAVISEERFANIPGNKLRKLLKRSHQQGLLEQRAEDEVRGPASALELGRKMNKEWEDASNAVFSKKVINVARANFRGTEWVLVARWELGEWVTWEGVKNGEQNVGAFFGIGSADAYVLKFFLNSKANEFALNNDKNVYTKAAGEMVKLTASTLRRFHVYSTEYTRAMQAIRDECANIAFHESHSSQHREIHISWRNSQPKFPLATLNGDWWTVMKHTGEVMGTSVQQVEQAEGVMGAVSEIIKVYLYTPDGVKTIDFTEETKRLYRVATLTDAVESLLEIKKNEKAAQKAGKDRSYAEVVAGKTENIGGQQKGAVDLP